MAFAERGQATRESRYPGRRGRLNLHFLHSSRTTLPFIASLTPARVAVPLHASTKDAVLAALVALAAPDSPMQAELLDAVMAREAEFPTALGDGVAFSHVRTPLVRDVLLSAAVLDRAIAFGAANGNPVDVLFLLLSPTQSPSQHLQALRALSQVVSDATVIARLRAATSPEQFVTVVRSVAR